MTPAPASTAVLITGCSSGIGRATALRLLRRGRPVYATARRVEALAELADAGAVTLPLDVTDEESMRAAVAQVEAAHGAVGALVNNAGYGHYGPVEQTSIDHARAQFETNFFGLVRLTQLVLPAMRAQRQGRVVNVSSMGGRLTMPGGGFYHASKYAVEAVSDALRLELANFGVRVSLVEPGPVLTPWADTAVATAGAGAADGGANGAAAHDGDHGAYGAFRADLAARLAHAYNGPMKAVASSPDDVAKTIERALHARSPRPRYVVGPIARMLTTTKRVLPDRGFDLVMRTQYSLPTP